MRAIAQELERAGCHAFAANVQEKGTWRRHRESMPTWAEPLGRFSPRRYKARPPDWGAIVAAEPFTRKQGMEFCRVGMLSRCLRQIWSDTAAAKAWHPALVSAVPR